MRRTIKKVFKELNDGMPDRIKSMRVEAGFSQTQLAAKLPKNVSQATISNWEKGKTDVGFVELITICLACGQSPKMFLPTEIEENKSLNKEEIQDDWIE